MAMAEPQRLDRGMLVATASTMAAAAAAAALVVKVVIRQKHKKVVLVAKEGKAQSLEFLSFTLVAAVAAHLMLLTHLAARAAVELAEVALGLQLAAMMVLAAAAAAAAMHRCLQTGTVRRAAAALSLSVSRRFMVRFLIQRLGTTSTLVSRLPFGMEMTSVL